VAIGKVHDRPVNATCPYQKVCTRGFIEVFCHASNSLRSVMPIVVSVLLSLRSLVRSRAALHFEILALRHQLHVVERSRRPRLRLTSADRLLWVWLSGIWTEWRPALVLVQPATVVAWHRRGFRLFWTWKSRHRTGRPPTGRRPHVDPHDVSGKPAVGCASHPRRTAQARPRGPTRRMMLG
jgi:hypothetical protein